MLLGSVLIVISLAEDHHSEANKHGTHEARNDGQVKSSGSDSLGRFLFGVDEHLHACQRNNGSDGISRMTKAIQPRSLVIIEVISAPSDKWER